MTQPDVQDILALMCAPALVCSADGVVESMNEGAADWLGITTGNAAGQSLAELLSSCGEKLTVFLQRSHRSGHACCNGHLAQATNRSSKTAMICHAQRMKRLQPTGALLLVFTNVVPGAQHSESLSEGGIWLEFSFFSRYQ